MILKNPLRKLQFHMSKFDDLIIPKEPSYTSYQTVFVAPSKLTVRVKKLYEDSELPTRGSIDAAGWDLYAHDAEGFNEVIFLRPHETVKVNTGLAMAIERGWEGQIRPRSGLATKFGLRPANTPGTIDCDYRGPIIVALHNDTDEVQSINKGDRIAQICFRQVPDTFWKVVDKLDETTRGEGGFGSSGK